MKHLLQGLFAYLWLAVLPQSGLSGEADAVRGKVVAEVRCLPCHHLHLTSKRVGPGLKGIFNRAPGISGVPFERWDAASLDAWLSNPRAIKPNTTMFIPPMAARDRADVIAYFRKVENSEAENE